MTAENATSAITEARLLAVLQRTSANRRQRRATARIGQCAGHGHRQRKRRGRLVVERADDKGWDEKQSDARDLPMLRSGTKESRDEVRWSIAIRRCLRLSPMDEKKKAPVARAAPGRWVGLLWREVLVIAQVHHVLEHRRARRQIDRVEEQGVKGVTPRGRTVDRGAAFEYPSVVFRVVHADQ